MDHRRAAEFESWMQYRDFQTYVRTVARHILDGKNQRFLETVIATSEIRRASIKAGTRLWRAQLGSVDERKPYPPERMKPLVDRATEGRLNPKGIPCLYCSTGRDTAMAETRPWMGSLVSVAELVVLRDLTVVDCTADRDQRMPIASILQGVEPEPSERERCVWGTINAAFSQPVTRSDTLSEYAPTQLLAEAFRYRYDGVVYESNLGGSGKNIAIFDLTAAEVANCQVFEVEAVKLSFVAIGEPVLHGEVLHDGQAGEPATRRTAP